MTVSFKWVPAESISIPADLSFVIPIVSGNHATQNIVERLCRAVPKPSQNPKNKSLPQEQQYPFGQPPIYIGRILSNDVLDYENFKVLTKVDPTSGVRVPTKLSAIHTSVELYLLSNKLACVILRSPTFEKRLSSFWGDLAEFLRDTLQAKSIILLGTLSQKARYDEGQFETSESVIFRECTITTVPSFGEEKEATKYPGYKFSKLTSFKQLEDFTTRDINKTIKAFKEIPTVGGLATILRMITNVFLQLKHSSSSNDKEDEEKEGKVNNSTDATELKNSETNENTAVESTPENNSFKSKSLVYLVGFIGDTSDDLNELLYNKMVEAIKEIIDKQALCN